MIRIATMNDLIAADDQKHWESPPGFCLETAIQEIAALREPLSKHTGLVFEQEMNVQDASYFTELYVHEPPRDRVIETMVGVRFSSFARFFTILGCSSVRPLTDDLRQRIMEFVCERGFIYVSSELLAQPYRDPNMFRNWRIRFFDYL